MCARRCATRSTLGILNYEYEDEDEDAEMRGCAHVSSDTRHCKREGEGRNCTAVDKLGHITRSLVGQLLE